jgi:hypothetical protein
MSLADLLQPNAPAVYLIELTQVPAPFIVMIKNEANDIRVTTYFLL